jgi:hypothetical protein
MAWNELNLFMLDYDESKLERLAANMKFVGSGA